jgi:hypothetical protein
VCVVVAMACMAAGLRLRGGRHDGGRGNVSCAMGRPGPIE